MKKGDLIRYKSIAKSMVIPVKERQMVGIVLGFPLVNPEEYVEVVWSDGKKKIVFRDFIEVVKSCH